MKSSAPSRAPLRRPNQARRLSLSILPAQGECTVLEALVGMDGLLNEEEYDEELASPTSPRPPFGDLAKQSRRRSATDPNLPLVQLSNPHKAVTDPNLPTLLEPPNPKPHRLITDPSPRSLKAMTEPNFPFLQPSSPCSSKAVTDPCLPLLGPPDPSSPKNSSKNPNRRHSFSSTGSNSFLGHSFKFEPPISTLSDGTSPLWHIVLLAARTLKQKAPADVALVLVDVLNMDLKEAEQKVAAGRTSKTVALDSFTSFGDASAKAALLRSQDICVQVTSDAEVGKVKSQPDGYFSQEPSVAADVAVPSTLGPVRHLLRRHQVHEASCSDGSSRRPAHRASSADGSSRSQVPSSSVHRASSSDGISYARAYSDVFEKAGGHRVGEKTRRKSFSEVPAELQQPTQPSEDAKIVDVKVVPENAVEAFFRKEQEEMRAKSARFASAPAADSSDDCAGIPKAEAAAQARRGRFSSAPVASKWKQAVAKIRCGSPGSECSSEDGAEENNGTKKGRPPLMKLSVNWHGLLDAVQNGDLDTDKSFTPARKEACLIMHFLVYGYIHSESVAEKDGLFRRSIASREELKILILFWQAMDADGSGRVDMAELRRHIEKTFQWNFTNKDMQHDVIELKHQKKLPDWLARDECDTSAKVMFRLSDKVARELLGKKSCGAIEALMKLLWLPASLNELKTMKQMCKDLTKEPGVTCAPAPPVLSSIEYQDLSSMFDEFDTQKQRRLCFDDLVKFGVIYPDQVQTHREEWDVDRTGFLDKRQFCEMMCPAGYRAVASSLIGTQRDGKRVMYIDPYGWRLEEVRGPISPKRRSICLMAS